MRPLFLAAPGVANAQSAYFSFSRYLAWSDQPIYVLEKDNALDIAQLARRNAGGSGLEPVIHAMPGRSSPPAHDPAMDFAELAGTRQGRANAVRWKHGNLP